jgi:ubiquinone/menaquinone biosynthesis C-methylase UbiE
MEIPQSEWERIHYRLGLAGEGQADIIEKRLAEHRGMLLDIGCGCQGHHVSNLAKWCRRVVAADMDPGMIKVASLDEVPSNVYFVAANAFSLPFLDAMFDDVVGLGILAYIAEAERLFRELRRVTRRGGRVMLTNSVARDKRPVLVAASAACLQLVDDVEGYCPAASGPVKRRYLLVFEAH